MSKSKLIIGAGVTTLAAIAFPVATFAASGTSVTDTVQVTINSACSITADSLTPAYSATMTNGQLKSNFGSTSMSIACNDAGGWHLTAVGSGADTTVKTAMNASGSGTDIATGTATSGATSNWAMKVAGTGAVTAFTSFAAGPSSATEVANGTGSVSGNTSSTTYQVWVSATQQADTYTGKVTYTLAHPAST